jgi:hypothetical protein
LLRSFFTLEDYVLAILALSRDFKLFHAQLVTESFDFTVAPSAEKPFADEKLVRKPYRKLFFWVTHGYSMMISVLSSLNV